MELSDRYTDRWWMGCHF